VSLVSAPYRTAHRFATGLGLTDGGIQDEFGVTDGDDWRADDDAAILSAGEVLPQEAIDRAMATTMPTATWPFIGPPWPSHQLTLLLERVDD
jgi:hypothetical protein